MTTTQTPTSLFGNAEVINSNAPAIVKKVDPKTAQAAIQLFQANSLLKIDDQSVVLFGSDRQKSSSAALDTILTEITKGSSPVLFELFRQLEKGIEDTDLNQLETEIRSSMGKAWWHKILDSVGMSSAVKRIEKANNKIGGMLTSKSASLLALTKEMEKNIAEEVGKLITDGKRLDKLAIEFRENINQFAIYIEAGEKMLEEGKIEQDRLLKVSQVSGDPLDTERAKRFGQKVDMFEARLVVLKTIYAKAPVELESIRLTQGAALTTLGETANSALEEFNSIKSILIKLATAHQIQSVQAINNQRRALHDKLQGYGTALLGNVATTAAKSQGQNRVDDATKLLDFANAISNIGKQVSDEEKQNKTRYIEAVTKLGDVKKLMSSGEVIDV